MSAEKKSRVSRQVEERRSDEADARAANANPEPLRNKSRADGQRGHGGEEFSKGYGGGAGDGATSPAGPEDAVVRRREH
jgi:hypothetical protein